MRNFIHDGIVRIGSLVLWVGSLKYRPGFSITEIDSCDATGNCWNARRVWGRIFWIGKHYHALP
ncbi:MAG: hypothetical protein LC772_06625 [Chloroflexi bacterium]|nr:hypothetical protein [Chloroflexota bacterium]